MEVEPSLFVDSDMYTDTDSDPDSSSSWQRVDVEPHPITETQHNSATKSLECIPCEGLVLPRRYGRAMICIRNVSTESSLSSLNLSENPRNAQIDLQELKKTIFQAVSLLKCRVFEAMAKLTWSDITVRVYSSRILVTEAHIRYIGKFQ